MPAARRSGTKTPCAPNAAAERITAPRLRGSVTPSSATSSGAGCSSAAATRSSNGSYANGGTCRPTPWCSTPPVIRSSSARLTSSSGMPRSPAVRTISLIRSSMSMPMRDVERGRRDVRAQRLQHRVAADEQLGRVLRRRRLAPGRDPRAAAAGAAAAGWRAGFAPLRALAPGGVLGAGLADLRRPALGGRGPALLVLLPGGALGQLLVAGVALVPRPLVGGQGAARARRGLPGSCRRCRSAAPFFDVTRRPRRCELPGHQSSLSDRPSWTVRGVLDHDAGPLELVADRVGGGPVLAGARRARCSSASATSASTTPRRSPAGRATGPLRVERVEAEHVEHRPDLGQRRAHGRRRRRRPARCCPPGPRRARRRARRRCSGRRPSPRRTPPAAHPGCDRRRPARPPAARSPRSAGTPTAASRSAVVRVVDPRAVVRGDAGSSAARPAGRRARPRASRSSTLPSDLLILASPRLSRPWCTQ